MLLIDCPYCGERPELEFSLRRPGAHRPPASIRPRSSIEEWAHYLYHARQHPRRARRALAAHARLRALLQRAARHHHRSLRRHLQRRRAAARAARPLKARRDSESSARGAAGASTARVRSTSRFDGRTYRGFAGDTLASALLANGVHLVGRSFKYHRPRGILAAGAEEPNALVTVRRDAARCTPNLRATQVELYEGLEAVQPEPLAQPRASISAPSTICSRRFIPAGFYYKTFMWPRSAWQCALRAAHPRGRRPRTRTAAARIRTATRSASRIATCWSSARVPPGSPRHTRPPPPAHASSCATSRPSSAARCSATRPGTRPPSRDGRRRCG